MQGRLAAGAVEGTPQHLAVDRHNTLNALGEPCHEPLKNGAELRRVKLAEQPAERIVTGNAILKSEEAAQEHLFCFRKPCHRHRALPATQDGAQGDHQKFMEVVQASIAGPWILQTFPAGGKLIHGVLPRRVPDAEG